MREWCGQGDRTGRYAAGAVEVIDRRGRDHASTGVTPQQLSVGIDAPNWGALRDGQRHAVDKADLTFGAVEHHRARTTLGDEELLVGLSRLHAGHDLTARSSTGVRQDHLTSRRRWQPYGQVTKSNGLR